MDSRTDAELTRSVTSLHAALLTRGKFTLEPAVPAANHGRNGVVLLARFTAGNSGVAADLLRPPDGDLLLRVVGPFSVSTPAALEALTANGISLHRMIGGGRIVRTKAGQPAIQCEARIGADQVQAVPSVVGNLLRSLKWSILALHARMRRANLSQLIAEPSVDEFWADTDEEFQQCLVETVAEIKVHERGGLRIHYTERLAGGGEWFGDEVVEFIKTTLGPVQRAFEWCAGPGFLGYSLLGNNLCRSLCLADVNPRAVEICRETARRNGLTNQVSIYHSDCLDSMPVIEQWDLVIGNPPWSKSKQRLLRWGHPIKYQDPGLRLHRRFFRDVRAHLKPNATLVIVECYLCNSPADFAAMLQEYGFSIREIHEHKTYSEIYYMWIFWRGPAEAAVP